MAPQNGRRDDEFRVRANLRWVEQFRSAALALGRSATPRERAVLRALFWIELRPIIRHLALIHARRWPSTTGEDVEDIASAKTLSLLLRAERGEWRILQLAPAQIALFVSRVARNGVVDLMHRQTRVESLDSANNIAPEMAAAGWTRVTAGRALIECVASLSERTRTIWLLRVIRAYSSRRIASVPSLSLTTNHVDIMLFRARAAIRADLTARGIEILSIGCDVLIELERHFGEELDGRLRPD